MYFYYIKVLFFFKMIFDEKENNRLYTIEAVSFHDVKQSKEWLVETSKLDGIDLSVSAVGVGSQNQFNIDPPNLALGDNTAETLFILAEEITKLNLELKAANEAKVEALDVNNE